MGERHRAHLGERLHRVAMHLGDARHRVAFGKHPAQAGRYQQIAATDIGVAGQVGERERVGVAAADRDGAQPGALDAHRHRMLGIGDEDDLRAPRPDMGGLADEPLVVEHRLAPEDPVHGAAIEQQALPEAVHLDTDNLGGEPARGNRRQRLTQPAQLPVLTGERLVAHGAQLQFALRGAQPRILLLQRLACRDALAQPAPRGGR